MTTCTYSRIEMEILWCTEWIVILCYEICIRVLKRHFHVDLGFIHSHSIWSIIQLIKIIVTCTLVVKVPQVSFDIV